MPKRLRRKAWLVGVVLVIAGGAWLWAQPPGFDFGRFGMVRGTVESVNGNTLTVKDEEGKTTQVVLEAGGTITRYTEGSLEELQKGTLVQAVGKLNEGRQYLEPRLLHFGDAVGAAPPGPMPMENLIDTTAQFYQEKDGYLYFTLAIPKVLLQQQATVIKSAHVQPAEVQVGEGIFAMGERGEDGTIKTRAVTVGKPELAQQIFQRGQRGFGGGPPGGFGGFGGPRGGGGRGGQR